MKVVTIKTTDFDLEQTLECGQCFRYIKVADQHYKVIAYEKVLELKQDRESLHFYNSSQDEVEERWMNFLDLNRDYGAIKKGLSEDKVLDQAIAYKPGVRIMNQDIWECLISFIISQNKQIPHIKQIIQNISEAYGDLLEEHEGVKLYSFPTPTQLASATEADIRALKAGFRAPYIIDARDRVLNGELDLGSLEGMTTPQVKKELMSIKGVGPKIADCVMLFSLARHEVFPIDVWVKRIMEHFYLKEDTKLPKIQESAKALFGKQAGFAQQYLFYYARENKIGQ